MLSGFRDDGSVAPSYRQSSSQSNVWIPTMAAAMLADKPNGSQEI
jgi:hypothetical protein